MHSEPSACHVKTIQCTAGRLRALPFRRDLQAFYCPLCVLAEALGEDQGEVGLARLLLQEGGKQYKQQWVYTREGPVAAVPAVRGRVDTALV